MFVSEAGVAETLASLDARTREQWENRLLLMRQLTPGDFATVKRQSLVLDVRLTPEEWMRIAVPLSGTANVFRAFA